MNGRRSTCRASNLPADDQAQREFFESKIRPLLIDKCQSCHEGEAAESKLRVDSLDGLLQGGTRGASVVPGKPAESLLISAVKHGEVLKMPPKEKLSAAQIADLSKWVESGAYWPDAKPITSKRPRHAIERGRLRVVLRHVAVDRSEPSRRPIHPNRNVRDAQRRRGGHQVHEREAVHQVMKHRKVLDLVRLRNIQRSRVTASVLPRRGGTANRADRRHPLPPCPSRHSSPSCRVWPVTV